MAGIYQADKWCDECCEAIAQKLMDAQEWPEYLSAQDREELLAYRGNPTMARVDVDSDDWPSWGYSDDEPADSVYHCAARHECKNRIDLCEYGLAEDDKLHGAEERYLGALVSGLTEDGCDNLAEMLSDARRPDAETTPYQKALHKFWLQVFEDDIAHLAMGPMGDDEDEQDEQNYELSMQFAVNAVECVMMLLGNRRRMVVDKFFGHASPGYQDEWMNRDPFAFWCHLDIPLKRELVEMAIEFYTNQD